MQFIGFNLKKIDAIRHPDYKRSAINTNIEFLNVEKEKLDALKDSEVIKVSFLFAINYTDIENKEKDLAKIEIEGMLLLSGNKEEVKEIMKSWKDNKQISEKTRLSIINTILRKCSIFAFNLEEQLNLPPHMPLDIRPAQN